MKTNRKLYEEEVVIALRKYQVLEKTIEVFLKDMVHVGFGVEQIKRNVSVFDFKFYSKNQRFTKRFIEELKIISEKHDNIFEISESAESYWISCKKKKWACKILKIYKGRFNRHADFFKKNDFKFQYNNLAYDYEIDHLYAENEDLFKYRVKNFNRDEDEFMAFVKELACEDIGGEWAQCERYILNPMKRKIFRKIEGTNYYNVSYE